MHLLVDGYNLIGLNKSLSSKVNLQSLREDLLNKLSLYKKSKIHKITVVFDGSHSDNTCRTIENIYGIKVIYSKQNETADDIIKEIVENSENPGEILVVTSDNELKNAVRVEGVSITGSDTLAKRLKSYNQSDKHLSKSEYMEKYIKGYNEEEDISNKKGNPDKPKKNKKFQKSLW